jgi:hypothetical protein
VAANAEERPSAEQQSAHGTPLAPSSGLDESTLTVCLIALIQRLDALIAQNAELIEMMLDGGEQEEDGPSRPGYDLAGRPIQ